MKSSSGLGGCAVAENTFPTATCGTSDANATASGSASASLNSFSGLGGCAVGKCAAQSLFAVRSPHGVLTVLPPSVAAARVSAAGTAAFVSVASSGRVGLGSCAVAGEAFPTAATCGNSDANATASGGASASLKSSSSCVGEGGGSVL